MEDGESKKKRTATLTTTKKGEKLDLEKAKGRSRDLIWR